MFLEFRKLDRMNCQALGQGWHYGYQGLKQYARSYLSIQYVVSGCCADDFYDHSGNLNTGTFKLVLVRCILQRRLQSHCAVMLDGRY